MKDFKEQLSKASNIEMRCIDKWVDHFGQEVCAVLLEREPNHYASFRIIGTMIDPRNTELVDQIYINTDLTTTWLADHEQVKALSDAAFIELMTAIFSRNGSFGVHGAINHQRVEFAFRVLRYSTVGAELRYISQLGRMRIFNVHRSASMGGKLYRMSAKYPPVWGPADFSEFAA